MEYKEATNVLATVSLNKTQAHLVQIRFCNTNGWEGLKKEFPKWAEAISALPDS
jgi:hypothetical protein